MCFFFCRYVQVNTVALVFFFYIYFWPPWVFFAAQGLAPVVPSRGYTLAVVPRFLFAAASLFWSQALGHTGFSSCGAWAQ